MVKIKGHKETFGDNGYVYYLDCGDGLKGVCICPNTSNHEHYFVKFFCVYQLYFNKVYLFCCCLPERLNGKSTFQR